MCYGQYVSNSGHEYISPMLGWVIPGKILESLIMAKYIVTPINPYYLIHVGSHYYYIIYSYYRHTLFNQ